MRRIAFASAVLLATSQVASAQSAPLALLSGGWSTNNTSRLTSITGPGNLPVRVFRLDATMLVDTDVLQFTVIVDGVRIPTRFTEGSGVLVEGKSIAIEQSTPGRLVQGNWKVIQQPDVLAERVQWGSTQSLNINLLVASFQTEREFVLSINTVSTNCSGTSMTVTIDGTPVRDANGAVLALPEGSSLLAKGKSIVVKTAGNCTGLNTVNGDLRITKTW